MATLALRWVGGAVGGPVGAWVGGLVGAYLDNAYLIPALFPPDPIQGPRVEDRGIQSASEGTPVVFAVGPENRVTGTIIWASPLIEERYEEEVGGKGGGASQTVANYRYYRDLAIAVCEGEVDDLQKIWANGKVLYDTVADQQFTSDKLSLERTEVQETDYYGNPPRYENPTKLYSYSYFRVTSASGGPNLQVLLPGLDVTFVGWADGDNDGTFTCRRTGSSGGGVTWAEFMIPDETKHDVMSDESAGADVTVTQALPDEALGAVEEVTVYPGSQTQAADPLIQSYEGAADTPAFRGTAYMVVKKMALAEFGNMVPQMAQFARADDALTTGDAVARVLQRSGLTAAQYDVSACTGALRGAAFSGPTSAKAMLGPLMAAFDLLAREDGGKLYFFPRTAATQWSVAEDDLAAHRGGADAGRPAQYSDLLDRDLPQDVTLEHVDPANDYQRGAQRMTRAQQLSQAQVRMSTPVVMSASEARAVAGRILWTAWVNKRKVSFQLPPSYLYVQENDRLSVTADGESYTLLVRKVTRGHDWVLSVEALVEAASTLSQTAAGGDSPVTAPSAAFPPAMMAKVIDAGPLRASETGVLGFYYAAAPASPDAQFAGGGITWGPPAAPNATITLEVAPNMGMAVDALPSGPVGYWDRENTVDVDTFGGSLETKLEEDVLNGLNRGLLGNEVIAWRDATLVSAGRYRLSHLLRGLRDTEDMTGEHAAGETFVHLNSPGVGFEPVNLSQLGSTRAFKSVAAGDEPAAVDPVLDVLRGGNYRPFSPAHVRGERDGSNNLTITWVRRTRDVFRLFSEFSAPNLEPDEVYDIDIYDGATFVKTVQVSGTTTWTYTAAAQTTDGFTPGDPVRVRIQQVSSFIGRGKAREATL